MGKATIVSGGTAGLYTIRPLHNRERLDAEIARIEGIISDLEASRLDLQAALSDAEDAVAQARAAMDAAIAVMIETGDNSGIATAVKNLSLAAAHRNQAEANLALNTAQLATERLELSRLRAVPADTNQSAWCADYSESLSGEVATAEIPGEGKTRIIVRPGYSDGAAYSAIRDGQLFHREGMSPAQAYFNAAILPGWQKWMPTYRVGALTAVSEGADTGSVTLDAEQSSAQALGINQSETLTGVPIVYMDCNAAAFEVGDRVLVEFQGQDWTAPRIIGFESSPRQCSAVWPDQVEFAVIAGTPVELSNNGSYQHFEEALTEYSCSLAPESDPCADGPFEPYFGHSIIIASPAPVDRTVRVRILRELDPIKTWDAAPTDGGETAADFSVTDWPAGEEVWARESQTNIISLTGSSGDIALAANPIMGHYVEIGSQIVVRELTYVRAIAGASGKYGPIVGCVRCPAPEQPIWTQPEQTAASNFVGSTSATVRDWLVANTSFAATTTVQHVPSATSRTYNVGGARFSGGRLLLRYDLAPE